MKNELGAEMVYNERTKSWEIKKNFETVKINVGLYEVHMGMFGDTYYMPISPVDIDDKEGK